MKNNVRNIFIFHLYLVTYRHNQSSYANDRIYNNPTVYNSIYR